MTEIIGTLKEITTECDIEKMRIWRNNPAVRTNMYTQHEIEREEHSAWWKKIKSNEKEKYFIYIDEDNIECGIIAFNNINLKNKNSSWAFYSSPDAKKGVGRKMEKIAINYAFNILKLEKIYCEVLEFNLNVINLHKKFGFKIEGIFENQVNINNKWINVYRLGLLKKNYQNKEIN